MRTGRCPKCDSCFAWNGTRKQPETCFCGGVLVHGHVEVGEPITVYAKGWPGDRAQSCVEAVWMLRPATWAEAMDRVRQEHAMRPQTRREAIPDTRKPLDAADEEDGK